MKHIILFSLISFSLFLCGCNPFANYKNQSTAWQAESLNDFLAANHPVGSDEKDLISDFTAHKYRYTTNICPSSACIKYLISDGYCDLWKGVENEMVIKWKSDSAGKISEIHSSQSVCVLTP